MPAGPVALRNDHVHAVLHVESACFAAPASAATFTPLACACSITSNGGDPSASAISTGRWFSAMSTCELTDQAARQDPVVEP